MDERAELPIPLSRSLGQEHTFKQVHCHGQDTALIAKLVSFFILLTVRVECI